MKKLPAYKLLCNINCKSIIKENITVIIYSNPCYLSLSIVNFCKSAISKEE